MTKAITAIIAITILVVIALLQHTNGILLSIAIATIASIGGYALGKRMRD